MRLPVVANADCGEQRLDQATAPGLLRIAKNIGNLADRFVGVFVPIERGLGPGGGLQNFLRLHKIAIGQLRHAARRQFPHRSQHRDDLCNTALDRIAATVDKAPADQRQNAVGLFVDAQQWQRAAGPHIGHRVATQRVQRRRF